MASGEGLAAAPEARARRTGDERRALLVSATADLLLERGFSGTKTRDVTERCGVGTGLLNHYFTWSELRAHAFAEIYAGVVADQFRADVPALQLIDGYLRTCFIAEAVPFLRLWLEATELAATDRLLADELDRAQRAFLAGLTALLERLNREEAWGLPDPAATALRLSAMQDGFAGLVLWGYPGLAAATAEAHLRQMLDLERRAGQAERVPG